MTEDDRAGLAAEYVLGTLDADERDEAAALIARDPAFAALVAAWERRLGELDTMVDPVTPPAAIWMALRARLPEPATAAPPSAASAAPNSAAPDPAATPVTTATAAVTPPAAVAARPAIPPADVTPGPTELPVPAAPEVPIAEPVAPATPAPSPPPPFAPIPAELIAPEVLGSAAPSAPPLEPAHEPAFEPTPEPAASPPDVLRAVAEALAMPLAETDGRVTPSVAAGMPAAETAPPRPTPNDAGGRNAAAADTSAAVLPAASSRDDKPAPVAAAGDDVARAGVAPDKVAREIDVPAVELRAVDADGSFGAGKAPDIKILPDDDAVVPGYPRGPAGGPDLGPASGPLEGSTGGALVPLPAAGDDATVRRLVRSVQRWRSVAVGLLAFVLALAGLAATAVLAPDWLPPELRLVPGRVEVREVVRTVEVPVAPPPAPAAPATDPARHVAVLQAEGTTPAFIVSLQPDRKSLMVRRVKAADEGDKRYELWLVSDKYPAPRSLGLLGTAEFTIVPAVADFPPDVVADAVYAVSLEAEAGSPIDGPSTPVLASGRLIEAVPEMPASSPSGNGTP